jgi:predicted  nucleic acid-binding Zn-ribbon protein
MKELNDAEKHKKEQLEQISNQKEYAALKTEIERIKNRRNALEVELLDAWNKLENAQKEYDTQQELVNKKIDEFTAQLNEKNNQLNNARSEYNQQKQQRAAKEQGIPQEWLDKYELMREQVTDPVVPVLHGSCSTCFYAVTAQDLSQLKRHKLLQCKDCHRFLYIEEVPEQKEQKKE